MSPRLLNLPVFLALDLAWQQMLRLLLFARWQVNTILRRNFR